MGVASLRLPSNLDCVDLSERMLKAEGISTWITSGGTEFAPNGGGLGGGGHG